MSETIHSIPVNCAHSRLADPKTLVPHPGNPNKHPEKQIDLFMKILKSNGWRRPIAVSKRSGFVTKGHGALMAAMALGLSEVPVDEQDYENDELEIADILADNKLSEWSEIDSEKQKLLLDRINGHIDLELTGMDQAELDELFKSFSTQSPQLIIGNSPEIPGLGEEGSPGAAPTQGTVPGVPSSHVRMVQLYLNTETLPIFERIVAHFREKRGLDNTTDTVLSVLKEAHERDHAGDPLPEVPMG